MLKNNIKDKTARVVRNNGHPASGGHSKTSPAITRQTAFSRINRNRWDTPDTISGDNMSFQYQEYPKHIYTDLSMPKSYVVVNSADEEQRVLGGKEIINDEAERHRLLTVAEVNKVIIDKRWGPGKITKAIEDAGFDPTLDPFK